MQKILVTGGTVFVSRCVAAYFVNQGYDVTVLNRGSRPQVDGVRLIQKDRHCLSDCLKNYDFDVIIDVCSYTKQDVQDLITASGTFRQYIMISSGAVYPETLPRPFKETQICGCNTIWKDYSFHKWEAEEYIKANTDNYYLIRPPYLYGPAQNLYREPFVFDCASQNMPFYLPKNGSMQLQFFYIDDLCRFIEILIEKQPKERIFNVGNPETVTVKDWVSCCYHIASKEPKFQYVDSSHDPRSYFPFYDYEYVLDVTRQSELLPNITPLEDGLSKSYQWYTKHKEDVRKKPFFKYIEQNLQTNTKNGD